MTKIPRILIVDDEPDICEILRFNLEMEGYHVLCAENPIEAEPMLFVHGNHNDTVDLILLDVMMTPKSGFEWAKELKADAQTAHIPIIFCTAKTMEDDMLEGFALGSDDYICKPFRVSEVKARVKAVLHRTQRTVISGVQEVETPENPISEDTNNTIVYTPHPHSDADTLTGAGIVLNLDRKECRVDGVEVPFTKLEFELLALLLAKPGQVFSREKILQSVWPSDTIVLDRTVDVNITRIRKKIGPYGKCLRTKFGYGYMFKM